MLSFGHFFPNEKDLKRAISRLLVEVVSTKPMFIVVNSIINLTKIKPCPYELLEGLVTQEIISFKFFNIVIDTMSRHASKA